MRTLLHLSDLHFGRIHPPAIEALHRFITEAAEIDLIIMTGDWTQRARHSQFKEAAAFIKSLPSPILTVPGNHDVPLDEFWTRFLRPFARFHHYIGQNSLHQFNDDQIAVFGLSTVNVYAVKDGTLRTRNIHQAHAYFHNHPQAIRVLACHHPLIDQTDAKGITRPAKRDALLQTHPDLVLSGHYHRSTAVMQALPDGHQVLHLSAGTGTSSRLRGEENGFNLIRIDGMKVEVQSYSLSEKGFLSAEDRRQKFELSPRRNSNAAQVKN